MKKSYIPLLIAVSVVLIDQVFKIWIKTHMFLGQEYSIVGEWFKIHFTENYGMAFGFQFGGEIGKLILTNFRIIAVFFIGWYLYQLAKRQEHMGFLISVGLILAGALGNIIDSVFYGIIFTESNPGKISEFTLVTHGYATLLHGKVVDMLYFPVLEGYLPDWMPWWGGKYFIFFRPVFNIADASITSGVLSIFIFQKKFFKKTTPSSENVTNSSQDIEKEKVTGIS